MAKKSRKSVIIVDILEAMNPHILTQKMARKFYAKNGAKILARK
jgi:hypothetical protein